MEDMFSSFSSSHNGVSYSTIIIFGAFIFLILSTLVSHSGRVTEVLRKAGFFSMLLLYIQSVLAFMVAFSSPEFNMLEGGYSYFKHFEYAISILVCGGLMTMVHLYLKKNEAVSTGIVVVALLAALLFEYAYPWSKVLGFI